LGNLPEFDLLEFEIFTPVPASFILQLLNYDHRHICDKIQEDIMTVIQKESSLIAKLALEKGLVSQGQIDQCIELTQKSADIGLETTIEEVFVKQRFLTEEQIQDLQDISQMAEGGTVFGSFRLGKLIGQGGMGKVYEGIHEIIGRSIAIKVVNANFSEDKNNTARFYQEIRALGKLNHPNIVNIYEAGKIRGRHYFAMELLPGPSLKEYVDSRKFLEEKEALKIIRATARALGHAHARNVVHRDVKPENMIFDANNTPKLTDFGLVMHFDTDRLALTQEGMMVGSFYYASPEQVDGCRDIDGRSDIYSLGATLYYALTGQTVFSGSSPQELISKLLKGRYLSPRKINPKISRHTLRILNKMLATDREKRFQSMEEVVAEIDRQPLTAKIILIAATVLAGVFLFATGMFLGPFLHVF
jgi:serine/threonine protein kinase